MSQPQLKRMVSDIVLTLNMHPSNLEVEPAEDALIFINPDKSSLKAWICTNPFTFVKEKKQHVDQNAWCKCNIKIVENGQSIPALIMKLRIKKGTILTVVVLEHKNIERDLSWVRENSNDVIIISVSVYSLDWHG